MPKQKLKEISRGRYKSKKQKKKESVLKNIKLLYKAPEVAVKLFFNC